MMLVTGGTGFIGRRVTEWLRSHGHRTDTLSRSARADLRCDLGSECPQLPRRYRTVIHLAGLAHGRHAAPASFDNINHLGTRRLCLALEQAGLPDEFVYISSVAVYGLEQGDMVPDDAPLHGQSAYALSKIAAEQWLRGWTATHGVRLTILRPALVLGDDAPGSLQAMRQAMAKGRYLSIGPQPGALKSVIDVDELPPLIERVRGVGGTYNVCRPEPMGFRQIEDMVAARSGCRPPRHISLATARLLARIGDLAGGHAPFDSRILRHITTSLTFRPTLLPPSDTETDCFDPK